MVDTPENSGGGNIRVRNIRAERQLSREMTVERMTVNTGEEKNAEADLMQEVREILTDQSDTINNLENIAQQQLNALRGMAGNINTIAKNSKSGDGGGSSGGGSGDGTVKMDPELAATMKELREAIVSLNAGFGGGGGDDGGSGGGSPGDSAAQARQFRGAAGFADNIIAANPALAKLKKESEEGAETVRNLFQSGAFEQLRANLINLGDQIQSLGNNLMDMNQVVRGVTERFNQSVDAATSGIAEMSEVFFDFIPGLRRGGDNLVDTVNLIRSSLDNDLISTVGIVGNDLMEVSEAIHQTRMNLREQGVNAVDRLSFRELNEATLEILALERRRDVLASLDNTLTERNIGRQLEFAQMIATNTGRTADEVIKLNADRARQLRNLEAGGILQGGERENFERAINVFASTPGMGPFAELLAGIARSGGSMELFLANNPEMASDLAVMNQIPQLRGLLDAVRSGGSLSDDAFANSLMGQARGFNNNPDTGVAGASVLSDGGLELAGAAGLARDFRPDTEAGSGIGFVRRIQDFVRNNLADTGIVVALTANTAALLANTAALGGLGGIGRGIRGLGRGLRRLGRGGLGLLRRGGAGVLRAGAGLAAGAAGLATSAVAGARSAATGVAGAAATGARNVAGTAAGAGVRAGVGAGLRAGAKAGIGAALRGIPGLGLLAGLGQGAYYGLIQGDWTSAGLAAASGAASTIPGLGTAASVGLSAALVAREGTQAYNEASDPLGTGVAPAASTPRVGPTPNGAPSTQNAGIRTETQRLMVEHNRLLGRIISILEEQTGVFENIETNTTKVTAAPPPGFWDNLFGGDEVESSG